MRTGQDFKKAAEIILDVRSNLRKIPCFTAIGCGKLKEIFSELEFRPWPKSSKLSRTDGD
jgi:hypothetical protein